MSYRNAVITLAILAVINLAALIVIASQQTPQLTTQIVHDSTSDAPPGVPPEVAGLEAALEEAKQNTTSDLEIEPDLSQTECQLLLSDCRNACQELFDPPAQTVNTDCYNECQTSYNFCSS